jgi:hypothetical protein
MVLKNYQLISFDKDPPKSYVGEKTTTSGWGASSSYLKSMEGYVIDQNKCKTKFATADVNITDDHICMFKENEFLSSGDSGGRYYFVPKSLDELIISNSIMLKIKLL